jgi:general secretion pathway protein J
VSHRARPTSPVTREHGFTSLVRSAEHGFTLVEMMVALVIFGLLASAGTALLVSSVDAQGVVAERLDQSAGLRRVHALAMQDMGAALMRPVRGSGGDLPAFEPQAGTRIFALTRGGVGGGESADPRPTVRRVTWRLDQGRLTRAVADGADSRSEGAPVTLADNVAAVALRYRSDGNWQDAWRPTDARQLPQAVEIAVTFADGRVAPMRLPVGPGQ